MTRYLKALVGIVGAVATWATATFPDQPAVQQWVGLALAVLTAFGVYAVPNTPPKPKPRRKRNDRGDGGVLAIVLVALLLIVLLGAIFR